MHKILLPTCSDKETMVWVMVGNCRNRNSQTPFLFGCFYKEKITSYVVLIRYLSMFKYAIIGQRTALVFF